MENRNSIRTRAKARTSKARARAATVSAGRAILLMILQMILLLLVLQYCNYVKNWNSIRKRSSSIKPIVELLLRL